MNVTLYKMSYRNYEISFQYERVMQTHDMFIIMTDLSKNRHELPPVPPLGLLAKFRP